MSIWVNVSEVNNILGKALESCKDELSPSFYRGARLMLDKINEMAEETADTPQTDRKAIGQRPMLQHTDAPSVERYR